MLNLLRTPATPGAAPALADPHGATGRLPPRVAAALQAQATRAAARHFALYPQALGVALGPGSRRLPIGQRWVADVHTTGRRWWHDLGLSLRHAEAPMLFTDLCRSADDHPQPWAMLTELADAAPAGSLLLMALGDTRALRALRQPAALRQCHPRLRLDALGRPLAEAGAAWPAWGLVHEVLVGQPALALCEIGIDP